jgi:uncharacterized protein
MSDASNRTEADRQTIQRAFDAWRDGTGRITDVFAPEMVWRIEGHSLVSKEYESRQQFIDEVLTPFGARFSTSDPFRPITVRSVYADGDSVIVLWDGRGVANDGQPYENSYVWVMKMHEGKVIDEPRSTTASPSTISGPESHPASNEGGRQSADDSHRDTILTRSGGRGASAQLPK